MPDATPGGARGGRPVPVVAALRSRPTPPGPLSAGVDVGEGTVGPGRAVQAGTAGQLGVRALDALDGLQNDARVAGIDSPVVIEIVHATVLVVVDEHVRRVAELMAAIARPAAAADALRIVLRRSEAGHDDHVLDANAVRLEVLDHELQLVDQRLAKHEVLWPNILLIVREEVAETEMLGYVGVLILRRHLDEAFRILVGFLRRAAMALVRPEPHAIVTDLPGRLLRERDHRDERERSPHDVFGGVID